MEPNGNVGEEAILRIIREFDTDVALAPFSARQVNGPLTIETSLMLFARLQRAAINQVTGGQATISRYAIWAETVRGIILDAIDSLDESPQSSEIRRNLTKAANSLAAFSMIQSEIESSL